jgi:hypothetical protein
MMCGMTTLDRRMAGAATVARLERTHNSGALVIAQMGPVPRMVVSVGFTDHPELVAHAFVFLSQAEDGPVSLPARSRVVMVDRLTRARFRLPDIKPRDSEALIFHVRDLLGMVLVREPGT